MRNIGIALICADTAEGQLPVAIYSKDGKPLLSWRVMLLPGLERGKLYEQFHLDEPWDSPHNIKLLPKMPEEYPLSALSEINGGGEQGLTYYQGSAGPGALFELNRTEPLSLDIVSKRNGAHNRSC